jgi:hemerythrin superfamily protein
MYATSRSLVTWVIAQHQNASNPRVRSDEGLGAGIAPWRHMKATDLLKQQHRTVEALFAEIEAGESEALKTLASALAAHMAIEHEFLYPKSREVDEDAILEAFEEHAIAETALKRALATDSEDESFEARVKVLKELIEHHVEEEEGELFPELEKELGSEELEALGIKMEARFEEVLKKGYAAVLPQNYEETTADAAQAAQSAA